jgi:cell division inhibitor SepF
MALRKVAEYLGLVESDAYGSSDAFDTFPAFDESARVPVADSTRSSYAASTASTAATLSALHAASPASAPRDMYRITTIHPRTYNDARRIGEDFRAGTPVIMNVGEMDDNDARRIVDFAAGLAFGLHGSIERITRGVFLLSPANVDVGAAARAQLREDPFFNQS